MSGGCCRHLVSEVANTTLLLLTTSLAILGLRSCRPRMRLLELTRCSQPGRKLSMVHTSRDLGLIVAGNLLAVSSPLFFEMKVLSGDLLLMTRRSIMAWPSRSIVNSLNACMQCYTRLTCRRTYGWRQSTSPYGSRTALRLEFLATSCLMSTCMGKSLIWGACLSGVNTSRCTVQKARSSTCKPFKRNGWATMPIVCTPTMFIGQTPNTFRLSATSSLCHLPLLCTHHCLVTLQPLHLLLCKAQLPHNLHKLPLHQHQHC